MVDLENDSPEKSPEKSQPQQETKPWTNTDFQLDPQFSRNASGEEHLANTVPKSEKKKEKKKKKKGMSLLQVLRLPG